MSEQLTGYEIRPQGSMHSVFMIKVNGSEIPVDRQRSVFDHAARDRAQVVCDALNNGLVSRVYNVALRERGARDLVERLG